MSESDKNYWNLNENDSQITTDMIYLRSLLEPKKFLHTLKRMNPIKHCHPFKEDFYMSTNIFVNLPVKDLDKSIAFFTKLGYTFNPQFTDENATCMIVSESIYVMLLVEKYFMSFTKKEIPDTTKSAQVIVALSADSREAVDVLVDAAFEAGAGVYNEPQDMGFMYTRSFQDLDGHLWEVFYMDPSHLQ